MFVQAKIHILTADTVKWEHEKSFLFMYIQVYSSDCIFLIKIQKLGCELSKLFNFSLYPSKVLFVLDSS